MRRRTGRRRWRHAASPPGRARRRRRRRRRRVGHADALAVACLSLLASSATAIEVYYNFILLCSIIG